MPDPIIQTLPSAEKALTSKYSNPNVFPAGVDANSPVANAMVQLDVKRALAGQNPYNKQETQLGLLAAQTGQAQTQVPQDHGFLGNVASDVRNIVGSLPRLPQTLFHEVQQLPQTGPDIGQALATNTGPLDAVRQIAQAPGIRMLPGSFIASNLGTPGNLLKHPVMTALDALPFAEKIPGVEGLVDNAKSAITDSVAGTNAFRALKTSKLGTLAQSTFGTQARDASQMLFEKNAETKNLAWGSNTLPEGTDPLANLTRQSTSLRAAYPDIPDERIPELTQMMQTDADQIANLPPRELAYVNEARTIADGYGDFNVSQGLLGKIDGEYYTTQDAAKILKAQDRTKLYNEMGDIHNAVNPNTPNLTPEDILPKIDETLGRTDIPIGGQKGKLFRVEGYAHALQTAGYDASTLLDGIRQVRGMTGAARVGQDAALSDLVDTFKANPLGPVSSATVPDLITSLSKYTTDPEAVLTADALKNGRWQDARVHAKNIARRTKFSMPNIEDAVSNATSLAQGNRYLNKISQYDPSTKAFTRITNAADKAMLQHPPARFIPKLQEDVRTRLTDVASANAVKLTPNPDWDTILQSLRDQNYGWLKKEGLIDDKEYNAIVNDVKQTWAEQKAAGYDPVFVHSVSPNASYSIANPKVLEHLPTPTQIKTRMMDMTPAVKDINVALSHQGIELLVRRGSEEYVKAMAETFGQSKQTILEDYLPYARTAAEKRPFLDVMGHAQTLMSKEWEKFDPEGMFGLSSPTLKAMAGNDDIFLPRTLTDNLRRVRTPYSNRITTAIDPLMGVYRTALLPLSLRWHINTTISGGVLTAAVAGLDAFSHLKEAWDMVKNDHLPPGMPAGGLGDVPRDVMEWNKSASLEEKAGALYQYAGGKTMRRLLDSTTGVRDAFGNVVAKSYDIKTFTDNLYRSMAYLTGQDRALVSGLSTEDAHAAGIELTRKTMMSWDRMTPVERSVIRYAFPFYGWMSHITKVAMTMPFDHPWRTAVIGSFARNELADMGTAMPQKFLNGFFVGGTDKSGNKSFVNIGGMNPFASVSNYFTLGGLTSQMNPIIGSLLQTMGIDPSTGGPDLFPTLRYDPVTGRLAAQPKSPFETFATNILPQSQILLAMAGASSQFKSLMAANPQSAMRSLMSSAGIPLVFKPVNIAQEDIIGEKARIDAQTKVMSSALKSGDWSEAQQYPALASVLAQLAPLDKGHGLDQFKPAANAQASGQLTPGQNAIGSAENALLGALTP